MRYHVSDGEVPRPVEVDRLLRERGRGFGWEIVHIRARILELWEVREFLEGLQLRAVNGIDPDA